MGKLLIYLVPKIIGVIIFGGWVVRDAKKFGIETVTPINGRLVLLIGFIISDIILIFLGIQDFSMDIGGIWATIFIVLFIEWAILTLTGKIYWKTTFIKSFKAFMIFMLGWAVLTIIGFTAIYNIDSFIPDVPNFKR